MKDTTMNDVEIKDIDKLKNLLIEFGVEFKEFNGPATDAIVIGDSYDYYSQDFIFNKDGDFQYMNSF